MTIGRAFKSALKLITEGVIAMSIPSSPLGVSGGMVVTMVSAIVAGIGVVIEAVIETEVVIGIETAIVAVPAIVISF